MTGRATDPSLLEQLKRPASSGAQVRALKTLKNEIIGHEQKKRRWIDDGVLAPLVRILAVSKSDGRQARSRDTNGSNNGLREVAVLTDEDQARLQATIVIGSLTHDCSSVAASLLRTTALSSMLLGLSPGLAPPQLVRATLHTLNTIADALSLSPWRHGTPEATFSNLLYSSDATQHWLRILEQTSSSSIVQQQISLAASLIAKTCSEERHQEALASAGVLDALATRLASFVVSKGFVVPGADKIALSQGRSASFPSPAPPSAQLPPILEALNSIIQGSTSRASKLLLSPAILAVFPSDQANALPEGFANPYGQPHPPLSRTSEQGHLNPLDYLLPPLPTPPKPPSASAIAFPPLGSAGPGTGAKISNRSSWPPDATLETGSDPETSDGDESPLIAWLFCIARAEDGLARLMAAMILTVLYKSGLAHKRRETSLALLIVPLLVRMFDDDGSSQNVNSPLFSKSSSEVARVFKEYAPAVLATLVTDSIELQKAAVDAHAIKKLSKLLKAAFDPIPEPTTGSTWSPFAKVNSTDTAKSRGVVGPELQEAQTPAAAIHTLKVRASALKALAALAPFKDEYRKKIIDTGITPFLVSSLKPLSADGKPSTDTTEETANGDGHPKSESDGNPAMVLIAACGAVRALSRSVSILRTSLIDAGVAMPLFQLLSHPDIEVQVAATAAVCNLVLEFSPMREAIMQAGVLKILCQHAHSTNSRLRLNAVWALKHLVFSAENDIKMACFEELGQGWLVQLICDDTENTALASGGTVNGGSESIASNGALKTEQADEDTNMSDANTDVQQDGRGVAPLTSSDDKGATLLNEQVRALRETEAVLITKARRDDVLVQEQGLDFIRNLICGPGSVSMIDFLFQTVGKDKVFEILAMKLRPKVITSHSQEPQTVDPESEIITAVCFILVHIAASHPRHRQVLVSQTELLQSLLPYFAHHNKHIRVALAWMVINLTWVDDHADQGACKDRTLELKRLGFYTHLEGLEQDPELDVRERTKTALFQLRENSL